MATDRIQELEAELEARNLAYKTLSHSLKERRKEVERLRDAAPDYHRVKRAMKLAEGEYVGQAWGPLWDWAWKEAQEDKG